MKELALVYILIQASELVYLRVELPNAFVRIMSADGKEIWTSTLQSGNNTIDISQFQTGIYLVIVQVDSSTTTRKLIIE
jgi:hypothetical protein